MVRWIALACFNNKVVIHHLGGSWHCLQYDGMFFIVGQDVTYG